MEKDKRKKSVIALRKWAKFCEVTGFFQTPGFFLHFFSTRTCTQLGSVPLHTALYIHTIATSGFFFSFTNTNIFAAMRIFVSVFFLYILFFYSVYSFSLSHSLCFFFPFNNYTFLLFLFPRVKKRKRIENFMEIGKVFPFRLFILFIKIR